MANPVAPAPPPGEPGSQRLRAMAVLVVVVCLFATLVGRLWYLQGVEGHTPQTYQLTNEGEETIYIPAPRGDIFDRNGDLLAGNRIEQVVTVDPGAVLAHPGIVDELSALLGEPVSQVKAAIDNDQYSPYEPVPVKEGVSEPVVLAIDENQALLPHVKVQAEPVRYYPYGTITANIIGYVSQINGTEYAQDKTQQCGPGIPCYQPNSLIGQAGVEASLEQYLRGRPGKEVVAVDSQGQVLYQISYTPPVPGDNIVLSVSLADQEAAVEALNYGVNLARNGPNSVDTVSGQKFRAPAASMVVEDPRNGQILALATYPDYDPADFIQPGGISDAEWAYYNNPKNDYPTIDRAISTPYQPGSTWKLITATAELDYNLRGPYEDYFDPGSFSIGNTTYHDNADSGSGYVDLQQAITVSSDAYFYSLGYQFWQMWANEGSHPEDLQQIASQYGFGHYSGIDLPGEAPGIVPRQQVFTKQHEQYPQDYPETYFEPGQEVLEAIGEGEDEVTPLQLANAYATFANGGTLYVPQVALAVEEPGTGDRPNGKITRYFPSRAKERVTMPGAADRAVMLAGFEGVTSDSTLGTAAGAFSDFPLSQYPVAGKTGTAQVDSFCPGTTDCPPGEVPWPKYKQDTSVFTSFAPADDPRFVVDAVFEQSGYGADVAAPAVEQEYMSLFGLNKLAGNGRCPATTTTSGATTTTSAGAAATTTTGGAGCSATPTTNLTPGLGA
jgi:penicillin-binding protein 2